MGIKERRAEAFPNEGYTYSGEKITMENPDNIEERYRTGKTLEGLSKDELDWRKDEIERLGGLKQYQEKYGQRQQRTGEVVNRMYNAPEGMGVDTAIGTEVYQFFKSNNDKEGMRKWMIEQKLAMTGGDKNKLTKTPWKNV